MKYDRLTVSMTMNILYILYNMFMVHCVSMCSRVLLLVWKSFFKRPSDNPVMNDGKEGLEVFWARLSGIDDVNETSPVSYRSQLAGSLTLNCCSAPWKRWKRCTSCIMFHLLPQFLFFLMLHIKVMEVYFITLSSPWIIELCNSH